MSDDYIEVSHQSWGSRLMDSIKGVGIGILLFLISFPLIWWNEGRAVRTAKGLDEGSGAVVSLKEATVRPDNEGKLVHLTGKADTADLLNETVTGVKLKALKLIRTVEMYQWSEKVTKKSKKKLGGSKQTVKKYSYSMKWSSTLINSESFKKREKYINPGSMPIKSGYTVADKVTLGGFTLPSGMVSKIGGAHPVDLNGDNIAVLPLSSDLKDKAVIQAGAIFVGDDPAVPQLGDLRISVSAIDPQVVSLVAQQTGGTFTPYITKQDTEIFLLSTGTVTAAGMFKQAHESNNTLTWILRLAGFLAMLIGIIMIFQPLVVLTDVLPFLGSILGFGVFLFGAVVAISLSSVTISIAWVVFRPLIGVPMLVGGVGLITAFIILGRKRRLKKKAAA